MANKRIELEQYRCYVNLFDEEPNRKRSRSGVTMAMVGAALLVVLLFVLALLSGSLAGNPSNVLEKPPAPSTTPTETTPGTTTIPSQGTEQIPGTEIPLEQTVPATTVPESSLPQDGKAVAAARVGDGLLAQAEGTEVPVQTTQVPVQGDPSQVPVQGDTTQVPVQVDPSQVPVQIDPSQVPTSTEPTTTPAGTTPGSEEAKDTGPSTQTTGVGNLSNLAKQINGRGWQLYMLLLLIVLGVVIYLTLSRARKEGKAR